MKTKIPLEKLIQDIVDVADLYVQSTSTIARERYCEYVDRIIDINCDEEYLGEKIRMYWRRLIGE